MGLKDLEFGKKTKVNREHDLDSISDGLEIGPIKLSNHLAKLKGEKPRVGDLGGGTGIMAAHLNSQGIETINIDPGWGREDEEHHIREEYGKAHFPHSPHLILANQSVVSLPNNHMLRNYYADFNEVTEAIVNDADQTVGTVVMDASWNVEKPIEKGLQTLINGGFKLIKPKNNPKPGSRMSMVFSRVKDLNINDFKNEK